MLRFVELVSGCFQILAGVERSCPVDDHVLILFPDRGLKLLGSTRRNAQRRRGNRWWLQSELEPEWTQDCGEGEDSCWITWKSFWVMK